MDKFKNNHKPATPNAVPAARPGAALPVNAPKGNVPTGQSGWQKPNTVKKTG